ncbi:NAD-dependent protein deacetylase-like [Amphiura filiformis]|uniref:NAD-dependent protein deacetylase-like n=1 Tax=Amphiura filiformis TaxID=82378 RepID=UPI003B219D76
MSALEDAITSAALAIHDADALLIAAGAGCSTDSGIPDYTNYANAHPQLESLGINVFDISHSELFLNNPQLAWGVYGTRMKEYHQAVPHEGYGILKKWCDRKQDWWVYVSNVDNMFLRSGFATSNVIECMGSIYELQCATPCCDLRWNAAEETWKKLDIDSKTLLAKDEVPRCPQCQGVARPCTKLATDKRWVRKYADCEETMFDDAILHIGYGEKSLAVLEIGCGFQMPKVRRKSEAVVCSFREADRAMVRFIRVNIDAEHSKLPDWATSDDISIQKNALQTLVEIDEQLKIFSKK